MGKRKSSLDRIADALERLAVAQENQLDILKRSTFQSVYDERSPSRPLHLRVYMASD